MREKTILMILLILLIISGCGKNPAANDKNTGSAAGLPPNGTVAKDYNPVAPDLQPQEGLSPKPSEKSSDEILEISEKMFVAQTNDIYYNVQEYLGRVIKYEGIFSVYVAPETGNRYYAVIRYGPGCCGIDANCGFEVSWDEEYPEDNDWVEVVGVLEIYDDSGYKFLRLAVDSLTVLPVRGEEYVNQ